MTTETKISKQAQQAYDYQDKCYITNKEGIATTQVIQELDDGTIRLYELVEFNDIYFANPNGKYPTHRGDNTVRTLKLSGQYRDIDPPTTSELLNEGFDFRTI